MTNERLSKTQAATLAEILRIEANDEPAVEYGARKGINLNAVNALVRKGFLRFLVVDGVGPEKREVTYVISA